MKRSNNAIQKNNEEISGILSNHVEELGNKFGKVKVRDTKNITLVSRSYIFPGSGELKRTISNDF